MVDFVRMRGPSMTMVVLVLTVIFGLQFGISYSATFGRLANVAPTLTEKPLLGLWVGVRALLILAVYGLWIANQKRLLFKAIILTTAVLTIGLAGNTLALLRDLINGFSSGAVSILITDVVFVAVTNILIFSVWYWLVDPPGIEDVQRTDEPWDFLFPQRADNIPNYEEWQPRYTDYLFVAFTTSFAFSPTDTLPLTRRAKLLMLLQSSISIVTLTGLAGGAINLIGSN